MPARIIIESIQDMTARHVEAGWQCPECYGVWIEIRRVSQADPKFLGFLCTECGCQWSPHQ